MIFNRYNMLQRDLGDVKTTSRIKNGIEQTIRLFTKSQRQIIKEEVENKPEGMTIEDVLNLYGVSPAVYYTWVRNEKEEKKENIQVLPNPLLDSSIINNEFFSDSQLRAFYRDKSPELKKFIELKFQEWIENDIVSQLLSKITSENINEVANVGQITINELKSFLAWEDTDISYYTVNRMKKHLGI